MRSKSTFSHVLPLAVSLVGALFYHRYSVFSRLDCVQADFFDSRFIAFLLEHWHNVFLGRADWRSPPIFFPVQDTLGYSDALLGMGVIHAILRSLGLGVFSAMNAQLILWTVTSFLSAYVLLVRGFRRSVLAATVGAYFFAFSWPRFAELVHIQLQFTTLLPLIALLVLECLRDGPTLTRLAFGWRCVSLVALFCLQLATTFYYAEFVSLFLVLTLSVGLLYPPVRSHLWRSAVQHWPILVGSAALAFVLLTPLARVYLPVMRESGGRSWNEVLPNLISPVDLVWMGRENWIWGWVYSSWPDLAVLKWPGSRLGVGIVPSVAWLLAIVFALRRLAGLRRLTTATCETPCSNDFNVAIGSLGILVAFIIQLTALRFGSFSAWWLLYRIYPGLTGIRAVGRIELVITLAMAVGFALLIDSALKRVSDHGRRVPLLFIAVASILAICEQVGSVERYSGNQAQALSERVAAAIPSQCRSAYATLREDFFPPPPRITKESDFDSAAYLAANPDVAANWSGPAWDHYNLFGRKEGRYTDPFLATAHLHLVLFFNYTAPLGAALASVPLVNGLSGWEPKGWNLFDITAPDVLEQLSKWLTANGRHPEETCIIRVALSLEMLPYTQPERPADVFGGVLHTFR